MGFLIVGSLRLVGAWGSGVKGVGVSQKGFSEGCPVLRPGMDGVGLGIQGPLWLRGLCDVLQRQEEAQRDRERKERRRRGDKQQGVVRTLWQNIWRNGGAGDESPTSSSGGEGSSSDMQVSYFAFVGSI